MLFPDGSTVEPTLLTKKELYFLGKYCELGRAETPEEEKFIKSWATQRTSDWELADVDTWKIFRAVSAKERFIVTCQALLIRPSLEGAFLFYIGAGKCPTPTNFFNLITSTPPSLVDILPINRENWEKQPPYPPALLKLAECYSLGRGCKKNERLGKAYFKIWVSTAKIAVERGDEITKHDLFKIYCAYPKENLDSIIDFATKGDQDMIRLLIKTFHSMGEHRLRDYWTSQMIGPYYDPRA